MELRLLLFPQCNRSCEGCCNQGFDLEALEVETCYSQYDRIMLTGGEPMLYPDIIFDAIDDIRDQDTEVPIILYTAKVDSLVDIGKVLLYKGFGKGINGITLTLHDTTDIEPFIALQNTIQNTSSLLDWSKHSLRLNVFKGVSLRNVDTGNWKVKDNIEWIVDCPLPQNERFKKYKGKK